MVQQVYTDQLTTLLQMQHRVYKVLYNGDPVQTGAVNISGTEPTSNRLGPFWHDANYYIKVYVQTYNFRNSKLLDYRFSTCNNKCKLDANRGVNVVMVTSGGSSNNWW